MNYGVSQSELDELKNKFRKWSHVKPRPVFIRLIVALDLAYKRLKELGDE